MANEPEDTARDDGTVRRQHYGTGVQPWDTIKALGWGAIFAASNVIKYLRRTKDLEHSLESARWYYSALCKMADENNAAAIHVKLALLHELTEQEYDRLVVPS